MTTIEDVASIAGVSKATVSRVINQRGNVHPDTVRAVREAIDRTQYEASPPKPERASATINGRNGNSALSVYALLVPEVSGSLYISLLRGFEAAAQEHYHQIIVCNTNNDIFQQGDEILQLIHKKVGGVAIVPVASAKTPRAHIEVLQEWGIPVVLLHRDVEAVEAPLIALPLEEAGYRAGRALLEQGHRRIGFFSSADSASGDLHRRGLERALSEAGVELPEELTCLCPGTIPLSLPSLSQAVDAGISRMWSLPEGCRPTGVYVTFDTIAEVVYMNLLKHGLRVPQDVSVVSFGSSQRNTAITSQLNSVVVDELAIGRTAVELLKHGKSDRAPDETGRLIRNAGLSLSQGVTLGPPFR